MNENTEIDRLDLLSSPNTPAPVYPAGSPLSLSDFRQSGRCFILPAQVGLLAPHVREQLYALGLPTDRDTKVMVYANDLFIRRLVGGDWSLKVANRVVTRRPARICDLEDILYQWAVDEGYFVDPEMDLWSRPRRSHSPGHDAAAP